MKENLRKTLIKISKVLRKNDIDWVLIGSASQNLQGMEFSPNDLDIAINPEDIWPTKEAFSEFKQTEPKELSSGQAIEFKIEVDNINVQFCADYDTKENLYYKSLRNPKNIIIQKINKEEIKLLDMKIEAKCYLALNHNTEKANKILERIKK